ncbi:DUF1641 domain-containing protein [Listeria ivanovii]|uniref:Putative YrhD protein n=1 Tax=Listeria ivanovii (strain ATCC BAA-678 / PAM 55) TaxID=881621 RepID=G2ZFU2_LISIP|nr:DUF1641 domain-containing protein [Listeria ivanovii]AHI57010.1 hypothetical protein AX25_13340 [Listeria ivanovii WSLC3009]AIS66423.1 hypothetical protein JL52_13140 [Listeria ivanovii subsp. ivanovii]MBC1759774.1 DUF1641 domain-containing protein [Listeria ivanovii]MBK3915020.1 DUF1641 domain-containing protein [Listeria ivanovii subsp. ivanovii]MBK3922356.1 DUF1641 domain-containing protein [Listeria ivanovii subsp. ivanovii]
MAEPISTIRDTKKTPEEIEQERLAQIKANIVEEDSGFVEMVETVKLLQESGALEALNSAIKARGDITKTFLNEWRKEQVTNAINNMMISSKLLTGAKPEQTEQMLTNLKNAAEKAEESAKKEEIMGMLAMMKSLKDPDVNRALRYGMTFLKEIGQTLK